MSTAVKLKKKSHSRYKRKVSATFSAFKSLLVHDMTVNVLLTTYYFNLFLLN